MANKLNRYDAATAIPLLEKQINALNKTQKEIKAEVEIIGQETSPQYMYFVSIYATRGNMLRGGIDSTVLQAKLYSWDMDITDDTPAAYFTWTRNSGDTQEDILWNNSNGNGTKNIIVVAEDVGEQSTFLCTVNDNDKLYAQAQIVISSNFTLEGIVTDTSKVDERLTAVESSANDAKTAASEAKERADSALTQMDSVNAEIDAANNQIESLQDELTTYKETVEAEYATKGELTDIDSTLTSQIEQNAASIASTVKRVDSIEIDSNKAIDDAAAAQAAANAAQTAADTAKRNYELLQQQADATDEALEQAKADVESAQAAADAAQDAANTAQSAANSLSDRVSSAESQITQHSDSIASLVSKTTEFEDSYATRDEVTEQIATTTTSILQTSEEITMSILAGYTTTDALETYKKEIENTFSANEEGFEYEFKRLEEKLTELGNTVTTQNSYIRLENGEIVIGQSGENASPITTVYTNTGMEIRYNGVTVAKYTDGAMEVTNSYIGNQQAYWQQWAVRKGVYVTGKGYNLNFVWIGG